MEKDLSDLSRKELWQLFPIILAPHDPAYEERYAVMEQQLVAFLHPRRISHIGSTAVPGLLAKPCIDILAETTLDRDRVISSLTGAGWVKHFEDDRSIIFNQGYTPAGFAEEVYHLHVRAPGDHDELYFRDYLRDHADVANEYAELKTDLATRFRHHRDNYTDAKSEFIAHYTALARQQYGERYMPKP